MKLLMCWALTGRPLVRRGLLALAAAAMLPGAEAAAGAEPAAARQAPVWRVGDVAPYSAQPAPEWTALFDRREGWTGADGVYSVPLAGDERAGSGARQRTLIWFSDTFAGTVNADKSRSNTSMVNNSTGLLLGPQPDPAQLSLNLRRDARGRAQSMVQPKRPEDPSERFWPSDAVVVNGVLHTFALRIKDAPTPPFAFATAGASLLMARADVALPYAGSYSQVNSPLIILPDAEGRGEVFFGTAIMPMTAAAGAPRPDGFLYVYGSRNGGYQKQLVVARVKPAQIRQFDAYRFWNGSAWVADIQQAFSMTKGVSSEFSVQPLADGRFLLVHMTDLLGSTVAVRYGASPTGPWGRDIPVWDCPEIGLTPNVYVYGAKAHPHLSAPGELLISYHVNSFDFFENFSAGGSDIYRPRFLKLPLP